MTMTEDTTAAIPLRDRIRAEVREDLADLASALRAAGRKRSKAARELTTVTDGLAAARAAVSSIPAAKAVLADAEREVRETYAAMIAGKGSIDAKRAADRKAREAAAALKDAEERTADDLALVQHGEEMVAKAIAEAADADLEVGRRLDAYLTTRAHWSMNRAIMAADEHVRPYLDDALECHMLLQRLLGVLPSKAIDSIIREGLRVRATDEQQHSFARDLDEALRRAAGVPGGWKAPNGAANFVDPITGQAR
ncbi:hypothetical protein GWK16_16325 [Roseomonas sp. JC162]|uniref:Uncharacterized protein n=1 Tax=Neoroseomonas marina TaxID=1232220 RepID=A0A848EHA7_9PROT|nr:hypothetical protein [Neoroseomonas marina]NMJ42813.1 hypothetical protein [Neoroseomonas marina]